ncbi:NADH:flavin oxidoreductase/NADH oxidase [Aspergillus undulatus]|uniref:NADH:flavin oxidoreductase/NADH oxidase n=1 Tax=Aspergillus undulatus TaxID=1810928 RepID=UPI003CCD1B48
MGSINPPSKLPSRAPNTPYFTPPNNPGAALDPNSPSTPTLFRPLKIRNVTLKNRIIVAPMCMFSCEPDPSHPAVGALTDWHVAHLGHLAAKGVGMVMIEATSVTPNGRISPQDSGIWNGIDSDQGRALKRVVDFLHSQGCTFALQLAHAGRKASTVAHWLTPRVPGDKGPRVSGKADLEGGGWPDDFCQPRELSIAEIEETVQAFARSAKTAIEAGVDVIEVHGAHGYLLHEFLSPVTNRRMDRYGGNFDNRVRIVCEILTAIRAAIPSDTPLFLRISATDWLEGHPASAETGSWDLPSTIKLAKLLPELGVDLLDVSSAGNHKDQQIQIHPNYQVDMAGQIRREIRAAGQTTLIGAVGLIKEAESARDIVQGADEPESGKEPKADVVLIARQFLREPNWVFAAAKKLEVPISLPFQMGPML